MVKIELYFTEEEMKTFLEKQGYILYTQTEEFSQTEYHSVWLQTTGVFDKRGPFEKGSGQYHFLRWVENAFTKTLKSKLLSL